MDLIYRVACLGVSSCVCRAAFCRFLRHTRDRDLDRAFGRYGRIEVSAAVDVYYVDQGSKGAQQLAAYVHEPRSTTAYVP